MDKFDIQINALRWGNTPWNALNEQDPKDKIIIDRIMKGSEMPRQPDIHFQVSVPNEFTPLAKYNIGVTAGLENTAPKPEWIEGMNRMNMNIVVSNFVKEVFNNCVYDKLDEKTKQKVGEVRVTKPMEVLFEGADEEIYKPTKEFSKEFIDEINKIPEKWCFLYVGHWLQGNLGEDRKDTGMMLKTFLETFKNHPNPPALIMKTSGATFSIIDRNDMFRRIQEIKDSVKGKLPNVYLLHGEMSDEEMNELYNHPKSKAMITFTKGEGYGRPMLEMSCADKPVIASDWSGHKDFLNSKLAVLLPGALTDVHKSALPKEYQVEGAKWFTVNYQYASKILKDVHKNYRKYALNAKKLGMFNRSKFSMKAMTSKFESILDKHLPKFETQPTAVNLALPKLKKVKAEDSKKMEFPKLKKV